MVGGKQVYLHKINDWNESGQARPGQGRNPVLRTQRNVFANRATIRGLALGIALAAPWTATAAREPVSEPIAQAAAAEPAYAELMASGRQSGVTNLAAASLAFRRAFDLAATDSEKADALLALGSACLADPYATNRAAIRAVCEQALALPGVTGPQQAEAWLGLADVSLAEMDYRAARDACARARAASGDPEWTARAQLALAKSFFQERQYPAARREFERLLGMPDLHRSVKWEAEALNGAMDLVPRIRTDHPRLFFNAESWPAARDRALTVRQALFDHMKSRLDQIPAESIRSGNWASPDVNMKQVRVMQAAFVYRVTGDPAVLEKVRRMLWATAESRWGGVDNTFPSIRWSAALDWVWNDLVPPERNALADAMLRYAQAEVSALKEGKAVIRKRWLGSWPHYYLASMFGYAGLALLDPGADDVTYARALSLAGIGFKQYRERFAYLLEKAGNDGVWQTNLDYDFCEVPNAVFPFFYAWQPATGTPVPPEWAIVGVSPHYALRMVIGLGKGHFKYFNYSGHSNGAWGFGELHAAKLYDHLGHFIHFFSQIDPRQAAIAGVLRRRMVEAGAGPSDGNFPLFQFLQSDAESARPPDLPEGLPVARFFDSVGLVLMSSGFGPDETYALFSQGGGPPGRTCDYDATHFSIYKKGFLALDTGVRFAIPHSANYRHQTVAHNAVLIYMPGETFPYNLSPMVSNSGGQNRGPMHAVPLAFETHRPYAYTAMDATPVYSDKKCAQMTRQFVYLPPDHFVVFDRVTAKQADFPKTWLLHTANEPAIAGREFRAEQGEGRIFCRTLLPADAVLESIGGPGKEFWSDGRNWPITNARQAPDAGDWWKRFGHGNTSPPEAMGRWRVEVKPGAPRAEDCFLHLIQVGGQSDERMVDSRLDDQADRVELSFRAGARDVTVTFDKTGDVGGHIRVAENGAVQADRALTREIMPQSGLALEH